MEPYISTLEADVNRKDSCFLKMIKLVESGLQYKYQPVWNVVLQSMQYLYARYGRLFPEQMVQSVSNLIQMYSGTHAPFAVNLNKAISAAFATIGPRLILSDTPLDLIKEDR